MQPLEASATIVLAAILALAIETAAFSLAAVHRWPWLVSAGVHMLLAAALVAWASCSRTCRADLRLPLLLAVMIAFLGPFGAGGVLLTMILVRRYAKSTPSFEEWYAALFPDRPVDDQDELWQRVLLSSEPDAGKAGVTPFSDILFFGSLPQKQELITLISKHFRPAFAPVLRMAINDVNNGIRVQAASAIAKIEDEFLPRTVEVSAAVQQHPTDATRLLQLARLHDEYVSAGLLDAQRERESRRQALTAYSDYLTLRADDLEAQVAAGRLLVAGGQYEDAVRWIEACLEQGHASPPLLLLYMEVLFRLNRLADLRRVVASSGELFGAVDASDSFSIEARETLKLWAGAA